MDKRLPPTKFCVDTLLPQGLCILGGSPKVGKSWLVLDLCVHVAQGSPLWELDVTKGEVLYLCLEDSERRIQERLNTVTDSVPEGMYLKDRANKDGECWPAIPTIARELKLSQSTVRRALQDLRKAGFLETEQRYRDNGGKSSLCYRLK